MKKSMFLLLLFWVLCCGNPRLKKDAPRSDNNTAVNDTEAKGSPTMALPESLRRTVQENGRLWLGSWNEGNPGISLADFTLEFEGPFDIEWREYEKEGFLPLDGFNKKSPLGWTADIYSYHTVMEGDGEISFGADQKVYVYTDTQIIDLVTLGSVEAVEEAFWSNHGERLVLLGYYEDVRIKPIIWSFDFKQKREVRYINSSLPEKDRANYFVNYLFNRR